MSYAGCVAIRDNLAASADGPLPDQVLEEAKKRLTAAGARPAER